jgi:hypothetical protein
MPCERSHCWNLSVANGFESRLVIVQPTGHPINHSEKHGFATTRSVEWAISREQIRRANLPPRSSIARVLALPLSFHSLATGVGNNPSSGPAVRRSGMMSAQHSPSRIVPQLVKVGENSAKPKSNQACGVFHESVSRSNLANNSPHLAPQSALIAIQSDALAVDGGTVGDLRAGKSPADDIDPLPPRFAVERGDVVPDRKSRQQSIPLSGKQHSAAVGIKLDSADGAPSKKCASQDASSCSCKKCQLIHNLSFMLTSK